MNFEPKKSLHEIFTEVGKVTAVSKKAEILKDNETDGLKHVLRGAYDKRVEWNVTDTPQTYAPLNVVAKTSLGGAIFTEASLSFLGLGIPPPSPSWGNLLGGLLLESLRPPWWLMIAPGVCITGTILAFNLLGDGLRDHFDPRLRGKL